MSMTVEFMEAVREQATEAIVEEAGLIIEELLTKDGRTFGDVEMKTPQDRVLFFLSKSTLPSETLNPIAMLEAMGDPGGHAARLRKQFEDDSAELLLEDR